MPLGRDARANIKELSHQCKVRGKFGSLPKMGLARCFKSAQAAGLSAARKKKAGRRRKR